jgi:hypothetical protein
MADVIDTAALLAFLDARSDVKDALVGSIYHALAERVRRGDFNTERSE